MFIVCCLLIFGACNVRRLLSVVCLLVVRCSLFVVGRILLVVRCSLLVVAVFYCFLYLDNCYLYFVQYFVLVACCLFAC